MEVDDVCSILHKFKPDETNEKIEKLQMKQLEIRTQLKRIDEYTVCMNNDYEKRLTKFIDRFMGIETTQ